MTNNVFSDDDIDAIVRGERPPRPRTTRASRRAQRASLMVHIEGRPIATTKRAAQPVRHRDGPAITPGRSWALAAAVVLVLAGVAALVIVPGRGSVDPGPATRPVTSVSGPATVEAATDMAVPGVTVSPQVRRLLSLPSCESADGLAEWTAGQLDWWRPLDPADAEPADFGSVTAQVAVDTAATSATCTSAITLGGALTWGLGDGSGTWVARATGVPEPGDFSERVAEGDDGTSGQFGTGQYFNGFRIPMSDPEPATTGALSPASASAPSPIYIVEFATRVERDSEPERLWYLRTTAPTLDETVTGPLDPTIEPSLVPAGFGRCTVAYFLSNTQGIFATAFDYCDETSTITATFDRVTGGEPIIVGDIELLVNRESDGTVRVGLEADGPVVIGPSAVPVDQLATMLTSIPALRPAPTSTEVTD